MTEDPIAILSHIGSGVVGGLIVLLFNHLLTKRRDLDKEQRAREESAARERKTLEAAWNLTSAEREIIRECACATVSKGFASLIGVNGFGRWLRIGERDFFDQSDPSVQAKYLDAFVSLLARGYFRQHQGRTFEMTGIGYERAKHDT